MRKCIHYWTLNTSIEFLYFPWKKKSNHKEVTILALLFSPKPEEYLYSHKRKSNWVASEAHLPTPYHTQLLSYPSVLSKKHEKETTEMNSHEILRRKLTLILMNANDPHLNLRAGVVLSSVRFSRSVVSDSLRPLNRSTPGLPVHHQLPEFTQTQVHWFGDAIQPLVLCRLLLLPSSIFPSIKVFSSESTLCIRWPKFWSFSFNISPSNEHPGLISFSLDWLDLLAVLGTLKSLLQHHSSKASILRCSAFFIVQLQWSIHDHWKNHSLD